MTKVLTDDEVRDRASKWARLHNNVRMRDRMDEALEGLSEADQRRVYLCGQRIVGGLSPKVLPADNNQKGVKDGQDSNHGGHRHDASNKGTEATQKGVSVDASDRAQTSGRGRKSAKHKK